MPRDLTPEDKQILKYIGLNPEDWERVVPQDVSELADQLAEDSGLFIDSALMDMLSKLHDLTTSVSSIYVLCVENEVGKIAMEHAEVKQSAVRDLAMNLMKSEINFIRDGLKESIHSPRFGKTEIPQDPIVVGAQPHVGVLHEVLCQFRS